MACITIIVAIDQNNGIGKNNQLLCHLPNDLKHFKQITSGSTVIMGRKTYESLPHGALPNRRNIVITRQKGLQLANCEVVNSLDDAFAACSSEKEVFVMGGDSIYQQAFAKANRLQITEIHARFDADAFFPAINPEVWDCKNRESHPADEKHAYAYSFVTYEKR